MTSLGEQQSDDDRDEHDHEQDAESHEPENIRCGAPAGILFTIAVAALVLLFTD